MDVIDTAGVKSTNRAGYLLAFLILAFLFCSFLRISLLAIYPLLVVGLYFIFKWRIEKNFFVLCLLVMLCWLQSLRHGFFLTYNLISFYFFLPFLMMLFAIPVPSVASRNYLRTLMICLSFVAVMNDIVGMIQYIRFPNDDSFAGIYGRFTVSQNGLSLINAVLSFYYLCVYQARKKIIYLLAAGFFMICSILGFYGAGLLIFIAAIVLTFLRFRIYNIVRMILLFSVLFMMLIVLMKLISPKTLEYNQNIIRIFIYSSGREIPRKIIIFKDYLQGYGHSVPDLLFGSGPGTFNSRTAFMVGSPTYFNITAIKSGVQPPYFKQYAYPLWNPSNIGPFDGFMNQPFSSILAMLGEYGLLFTLCVIYLMYCRFRNFVRQHSADANKIGYSAELKMYRFSLMFIFMLIIIDNYIEYPEIIGLMLIIMKLSQQRVKDAAILD